MCVCLHVGTGDYVCNLRGIWRKGGWERWAGVDYHSGGPVQPRPSSPSPQGRQVSVWTTRDGDGGGGPHPQALCVAQPAEHKKPGRVIFGKGEGNGTRWCYSPQWCGLTLPKPRTNMLSDVQPSPKLSREFLPGTTILCEKLNKIQKCQTMIRWGISSPSAYACIGGGVKICPQIKLSGGFTLIFWGLMNRITDQMERISPCNCYWTNYYRKVTVIRADVGWLPVTIATRVKQKKTADEASKRGAPRANICKKKCPLWAMLSHFNPQMVSKDLWVAFETKTLS